MEPIIQFVHVLCGLTFLGVMIISFFYITQCMRYKNPVLLQYTLRTSFFGDALIFFIVIAQFITGTMMVSHPFSFQMPWIIAAYHLLGLVSVCWCFLVLIKYKNYRRLQKQSVMQSRSDIFKYRKIFFTLNIIIFILFVFIIHDVVTQSTWF